MTTKPFALASILLFALFTGCGPAGKITGKVAVEGGQAGKILVRVLGPTSKAVLTQDSGDFTAEGLADGEYQVIAEVPNTEVSEQRAYVKVTNGSADGSPTLSFKVLAGQLSGKVVFADGSDASGLTVTLSGTDTRGAQTDSAGTYSFTGLKAGAYLISAEVPGSREGRQSVSVVVGGAAPMIPDLVFTLLGTLTGNVKAGTANAPNAAVNIPGTELFTVTDANGDFTLRNVPTGMRTVMARLNAATSSQTVAVVKGDNTPLAFTLQTALTGTVEGSVGFFGAIIDTGITVSAAGTTFSTTVAANGDFRLTLPPGAWEIVADARLYPRKSLGVHFVSPGATTRIPTAKMTLFRRLPFDGQVTAAQVHPVRGVCEGDYVLAVMDVAGNPELHLIDTNLLNRRQLSISATSLITPSISSKCKWVAFGIGTFVALHNVTTGEQRLIPTGGGAPSMVEISTDESVVFYRAGVNFYRYNIASGAAADTFAATGFVQVTRDRYLVAPAGAPANYQLVTTTGAATTAFSNAAAAVQHGGAAYGLTDCTAVLPITCTLRLLGTTGTTISTYATASVPNTVGLEAGNSTGEYYHFRTSATASILVRTSSGAAINMPASTTLIRYNPSGTRMAYLAPATAQSLREEALPGTGSVAPAATSTGTFHNSFNYVSDTRLIAFDTDATPQKVDIKSGTPSLDTDVTTAANGPYGVFGSLATWGKASTSKRAALLADGADQVIDAPPAAIFAAASVAPMGVTPTPWVAPKYGVVSPDLNTTFVVDAARNEVRKLNGLVTVNGQAANLFVGLRPVTNEIGYLVPAYDQFLWLAEPGTVSTNFPSSAVLQPTVGLVTLLGDSTFLRDLLVHRIGQQP